MAERRRAPQEIARGPSCNRSPAGWLADDSRLEIAHTPRSALPRCRTPALPHSRTAAALHLSCRSCRCSVPRAARREQLYSAEQPDLNGRPTAAGRARPSARAGRQVDRGASSARLELVPPALGRVLGRVHGHRGLAARQCISYARRALHAGYPRAPGCCPGAAQSKTCGQRLSAVHALGLRALLACTPPRPARPGQGPAAASSSAAPRGHRPSPRRLPPMSCPAAMRGVRRVRRDGARGTPRCTAHFVVPGRAGRAARTPRCSGAAPGGPNSGTLARIQRNRSQ